MGNDLKGGYRKTRKGRNPLTGEKIEIKGKNVVKFKPGKTLREKILSCFH
jgi:nucleoid DNA-binding protein